LARLVLANDVTEEIRADEQLQQSDRILSRVQSLVLVIDEEGLIIYASPAAEDILGYTPAQLLGEGWWQLTRVDPEEARREKETLRKIISGEIDLPTEPYERQIRTAYGDLRWIEWTDSYGPGKMLIGVGHDVTERKADSEKIRKQVNQLRALSEVNRAILSSFDLRQNIKTLVDRVIPQLQVDAANVMVLNPTFMKLKSIYGRGFKLESLEGEEVRLGDGNAGKAALTQKIVHVPRLHEQRDNPLLLQAISGEKFVSYYGVPLIARGKTQGVLEVFQRRDFQADEGWLEMLSAFASQAAIAIETITAFEEMQRSNSELVVAYNATIEGWSRAMDLRDKETEGARRVTELAEKLAERMGLRGRELSNLRRGALLHDIGMMGIPDGILLKPGKLSEAEREIVRQHPLHALNMLEPIQYLREALDIPYSHHEKWDGSGYPRGLKGEEIPLAARIFAVVDVYDALTNDRPYRKAWTQEKALEYIRKEAGKHFDPQVVTEFLAIV
jgi:PAS domain S-box-containing protein